MKRRKRTTKRSRKRRTTGTGTTTRKTPRTKMKPTLVSAANSSSSFACGAYLLALDPGV